MSEVAGLFSPSSLDDPTAITHFNYSLFRKPPHQGGELRLKLERHGTNKLIPEHRKELETALTHLRASIDMPLDHPDFL